MTGKLSSGKSRHLCQDRYDRDMLGEFNHISDVILTQSMGPDKVKTRIKAVVREVRQWTFAGGVLLQQVVLLQALFDNCLYVLNRRALQTSSVLHRPCNVPPRELQHYNQDEVKTL